MAYRFNPFTTTLDLVGNSFSAATSSMKVYVDKSGNDSTADGTEFKPFLTITAAYNFITDASTLKRYVIYLGPGTFTESTLTIKPWIWLVGNGRSSSRVNVTTSPNLINIDPSWATSTSRGGFINIYCTGTTGFNGDLVALGGTTSVVFELQDTFFNGNFILKGRTTADFVEYLRGYIFGSTTLSSIQGFFFQIVQVGTLTIDTAGTDNCTVQLFACMCSNPVTVNQTSTKSCTPQLTGSTITSTLTANKSGSGICTITADAISLPIQTQVVLSGGATIAPISDSAYVFYAPTTSANWTVQPTTVKSALDTLAQTTVDIKRSMIITALIYG